MKKLFLLLTLLLPQCSQPSSDLNLENNEEEAEGIYTIFSLNVHDFPFAEDSAETVDHVIDIHEAYDVPVDIYVDDHIFQIYVEEYPELVERLKTSPVVTVGYHLRAPTPYYYGYEKQDYMGILEMNDEELYETLLRYEEHKLDLETGETLDEPGGYQFVKDTIGYAPPVVSTMTMDLKVDQALAEVYVEKGAKFDIIHEKSIKLGEKKNGLYIRPEDVDYKLYEQVGILEDGAVVFEDAISQIPTTGLRFIGMKYHENNFYTVGTSFWPIYYKEEKKIHPLAPPFNLSAVDDVIEYRNAEAQAAHWSLYESTVQYASEHAKEVHPVSVSNLEEML